MIKAVVYVRVSTSKQEADNQKLQLEPFIKARWPEAEIEWYVDVITGDAKVRPEFDRMFRDARQGLIQVVVFWSIDRFSRAGALDCLQLFSQLDSYGVQYVSFQEQYLDSAGMFKDVVISIMATLAKAEKQRISERTKAGLERAAASGHYAGRPKGSKDKSKRSNTGYLLRGQSNKGVVSKIGRVRQILEG